MLRRFPRRDGISGDQRPSPLNELSPMAHAFLGGRLGGQIPDAAPCPPPPWIPAGCYLSLYLTCAQRNGDAGKWQRAVRAPRRLMLGTRTRLEGRGRLGGGVGGGREARTEPQLGGRPDSRGRRRGLGSGVTRGTRADEGCWREEGQAAGPPGGRGRTLSAPRGSEKDLGV